MAETVQEFAKNRQSLTEQLTARAFLRKVLLLTYGYSFHLLHIQLGV